MKETLGNVYGQLAICSQKLRCVRKVVAGQITYASRTTPHRRVREVPNLPIDQVTMGETSMAVDQSYDVSHINVHIPTSTHDPRRWKVNIGDHTC